jgi:transposase
MIRSGMMEESKRRFIGIDLGKRTWTTAKVWRTGKLVKNEQGEEEPEEGQGFTNGLTTIAGRQKLYKQLKAGDKAALEAGNLAFLMAKEIGREVGCPVRVLNPSKLKIIYASEKKTDKEDSLKLAHMMADRPDSRLPTVGIPSDEEMLRRKLLGGWERAKRRRTAAINQLHAVFWNQGITTIKKSDLAEKEGRAAAVGLLGGEMDQEEAEYLQKEIGLQEERIEALDTRMEERVKGDEDIRRLQTVPGVGPRVSFAYLAYVQRGRFENASQVANYLGMVPRVYSSGSMVRYGHITKRGNGYVRGLLVEAAWALIRSKRGGALKERYEYMTKEKGVGKKKAVAAVGRRLAGLLYTLLREGGKYEPRPFIKGRHQRTEGLVEAALSA